MKRILLTVVLVCVIVPAAVAAAKQSTIAGPVIVSDLNGDGAANYGDSVSFSVSTNETDHPYVNVRCYQDGFFVYDDWAAFWAGAPQSDTVTLSSGYWTGGMADCTARLVAFDKQGRQQTLASEDFHVAA